MKLFKKAAALFFCLALALSVMAVTALADNTDPEFTVTLKETTSLYGADINGNGKNEYVAKTHITYDVMLATKSETVTVNAFQFDVTINKAKATAFLATLEIYDDATTDKVEGVTAEGPFTIDGSKDAKFAFTTNGATGMTINSTAQKIGAIEFVIDGAASDSNTFELENFNIFATEKDDSFEATVPSTTAVEIDPEYDITIYNPAIKSSSAHVVEYDADGKPTYNELLFTGKYTILTGLVDDTAVTTDDLTAPKLEENVYYDFATYKVDTSSAAKIVTIAESSRTDTKFTSDVATNDALKGNDVLGSKRMYGDLVLNATYEPKVYTVTVKTPTPDAANGTLKFVAGGYSAYASGEGGQAFTTDSTTYKYTIEGLAGKERTSGDPTPIPLPEPIPAYKFVKYAYEATAEGNAPDNDWAGIENALIEADENTNTPSDFPYAIGEGRYGDVTLTAMFEPITYTATYKLGENVYGTIGDTEYAGAGQDGAPDSYYDDDNPYELKYTINDVAVAGYSFAPTSEPTRDGYKFLGWKAATTPDDNTTDDETPAAIGFTGTGAAWPTTANKAVPGAGKYGDVTLTAEWKIDGAFTHHAYVYTASTNHLMLFAVESGNVKAGGYTFNGKAMYQVGDKYKAAFPTSGDNSLDSGKTYTIFAYIDEESAANVEKVAFDPEEENGNITYDDDLTGNDSTDAGDYGIVVAMMATDGYSNNSTMKANDIERRLMADAAAETVASDEVGASFGTIADVRWFMDKALGKG